MAPPARSTHDGRLSQRSQIVQSPIVDWFTAPAFSGFHDRIVAQQSLEGLANDDMINAPKTHERLPPIESSMGMSARTHTIAASELSGQSLTDRSSQIPTLTDGTYSVGSTGLSASTGMASVFSGFPLLDQDEGNVIHPPAAGLECAFSFRGCPFVSEDIPVWKIHCVSHFFPHPPPRTITCPLCDFEGGPYPSGWEAWNVRLNHVALSHHRNGYSLAASRPDFALCRYLMEKKIITNAEYKDLLGNGGRQRQHGQYTTDNISHERHRR